MKPFRFFISLAFIIGGLASAVRVFDSHTFAADLWVVDTRHTDLPSAKSPLDDVDCTQLKFNYLQENETNYEWKDSTAKEFIETYKPEKPLVVIIHGNWMTYSEIFRYAFRFEQITNDYGECRLVFWSWNSDRTNLSIRQDALLKGRRADSEARLLAASLLHLPENSKVSLVGFSFGAKLICNTLQLFAENNERTADGSPQFKPRLQLRAVLLAAAMEQSSLLPNRKYGNALGIAESMLIHINSDDNVLCWYPLLAGIGGPKAIGKAGAFTGGLSAENRNKITTKNVAGIIGSEHGFVNSLQAFLTVQGDFQKYCLFE